MQRSANSRKTCETAKRQTLQPATRLVEDQTLSSTHGLTVAPDYVGLYGTVGVVLAAS